MGRFQWTFAIGLFAGLTRLGVRTNAEWGMTLLSVLLFFSPILIYLGVLKLRTRPASVTEQLEGDSADSNDDNDTDDLPPEVIPDPYPDEADIMRRYRFRRRVQGVLVALGMAGPLIGILILERIHRVEKGPYLVLLMIAPVIWSLAFGRCPKCGAYQRRYRPLLDGNKRVPREFCRNCHVRLMPRA